MLLLHIQLYFELMASTDMLSFQDRNGPRHDKTSKMSVRPAKTQISLGICPV